LECVDKKGLVHCTAEALGDWTLDGTSTDIDGVMTLSAISEIKNGYGLEIDCTSEHANG